MSRRSVSGAWFRHIVPLGALLISGSLRAQSMTLQLNDRGPTFYDLSGSRPKVVDGHNVALLRQRVALDLDDASVADAIEALARASHINIFYSDADVRSDHRVTLAASRITVAAALMVILADVSVDVQIAGSGTLSLARRGDGALTRQAHQSASLRGKVYDATTRAAVSDAIVQVEGTGQRARTGGDGTYVIADVSRGTHMVSARRLGYQVVRLSIVIDTLPTYTLDFALSSATVLLNQVVTTAVGDEHIRQLGHTVGTIAADSLLGTAPIDNLATLLTARVSGVQVFTDGGLVGTSPAVNIRGQNSYNTNNQPLLYVDGVRVDNSVAKGFSPTGRFDDIAPEEIQSVEIVKGPAAAALYGTDAANGIVLVTTKRGAPGAPRWSTFAEYGSLNVDRSEFSPSYYGWGTTTDGSNTSVDCTAIQAVTAACKLDSTTHFSPLLAPQTTPIGSGSRGNYGLQVSGGSPAVQYFLAGTFSDETGYLQMPAADLSLLRQQRGAAGVPDDEIHPNEISKYSTRANFSAGIGRNADVGISASYLSQSGRVPPPFQSIAYALYSPGYADPTGGWGFGLRPVYFFENRNLDDVSHFTTSATANWRPWTWLAMKGTAGVDYASEYLDQLTRYGEGDPYNSTYPGGVRSNNRIDTYAYTYTSTATASFSLTKSLSSATAFGGNFVHNIERENNAQATQLSPGCLTISCGAQEQSSEYGLETIVAGAFVEQTFGLADRFYLKGGARFDGGSTFGSNYSGALYPKASASWVISDEPLFPHLPFIQSLRLRVAYGESGTQPDPLRKLSVETATQALVDDTIGIGAGLPAFGNTQLKPERQRELEGGVDLELFRGRARLEYTTYLRRTSDALVSITTASSLGAYPAEVNAGGVRNLGYEILASVRPMDWRIVDWDITVNASVNHNKVLSLGSATSPFSDPSAPEIAIGYPMYSWFNYGVHWNGKTHNGVVLPSDLTIDTVAHFIAPTYPPMQLTLQNRFGFFSDHLQVSVQLDRRAGFDTFDGDNFAACSVSSCRAAIDAKAPISDQIKYAALQLGNYAGYIENGSFTRLREVSVTYTLPEWLMHGLHARSASVTLAGRNLAVWTNFKGIDPEVAGAVEAGQAGGAYGNSTALLPARYWMARVNLGI